jgi:hypothetical protein
MSFDPDDFQDQAAMLAVLQRQKLINAQNQKHSIPKNRQCPWCGGALPGQYSKCQHCSSDVSWVGGLPCKPQDEDYRKSEIARKIENLKNIEARVVNCKKCGCRVPQLDLKNTIDTCKKCATRAVLVSQIMIVVVIAVIVKLYYYFFV